MNDKVCRYCAFCLLIKPANYPVCACLSTHYIMFILGRLGCMYLPVMFIFIVFNIFIIFHPLRSSYTPLLQNVIHESQTVVGYYIYVYGVLTYIFPLASYICSGMFGHRYHTPGPVLCHNGVRNSIRTPADTALNSLPWLCLWCTRSKREKKEGDRYDYNIIN